MNRSDLTALLDEMQARCDAARTDLPRLVAAVRAVLAIEPMPNRLDMQPRDRDYAEGHNDALRLVARELTATLKEADDD